jgi:dihydroflavonol-4-reductase
VLLTGATGFVGAAVLRRLVGEGWNVRALVRPRSRRDPFLLRHAELVEGDLRDRASLGAALADCRYLVHVAADYRLWARHPEEIFDANVHGTRSLMEEALRCSIERVVYTSSVAVLVARQDGQPVDESALQDEANAIGTYKRSKIVAERVVREMVAQHGLPVVIVNPSTPIGPGDVRPTPTGRIIVAAAKGRMPAYVATGLNLVHVDDVAAGHVAALENGRIGERYILGGENVELAQMLADIAKLTGHRPPRLELSLTAALPIAFAAEAVAFMSGREPLATRDGVRMAKYRMFFVSAKAERELGYKPRPYRDALRDAIGWFGENGYF